MPSSPSNLTHALQARRYYSAERFIKNLLQAEPTITADQRAALVRLLTGDDR